MSGHPLLAVGFLAFFVVALVVGVRLLLLARRTRQLPELLIGIGVLGIGPVGFGLVVLAREISATHPHLYSVALGVGAAAVALGVFCKLVFNWRVYHPGSEGLASLLYLAAALLLVAYAGDFAQGFRRYADITWQFYLRSPIQVGALLWGSGEALAYWSKMRRRVRLGLADPVVANRFLLWGIGAGAAGVGSLIGVGANVVMDAVRPDNPWILASSSLHGLVAAVAMWLAFVPPAAYVRRVAARAASASA